jgi:hypothetical protein
MNEQTNKQTDRQTDKQTNRQTRKQSGIRDDPTEQKLGTTNWKSYRNSSHPKTQTIYGCLAVIPWLSCFLGQREGCEKTTVFPTRPPGKISCDKEVECKK